MQRSNTVQREDSLKPKGFSPQSLQAQVGDAVFWFNEDSTTDHQPYPTKAPGKPGDWGPPIGGQNSSQQLNLDQPGTYDYKCALHEDEVGHIIVANAVVIGVVIGPSGTGVATVAPKALSIVTGQCVSWGNSDASAHQPVPDQDQGKTWFAEAIPSGDISAQIPFPKAGTVSYHCALHPNAAAEQGTITIKDPNS